jgi:chaperonin cofactor prefoldin
MVKKTKKVVQILVKEKERLETRIEALESEGSEL